MLDGVKSHLSRRSLQSRLQCTVDLGHELHRLIEVQVGVRLLDLHLDARDCCSYSLEFLSPVDGHSEIFLDFGKVEVLVFNHSFELHPVKRHLVEGAVHV